MKCCNCNEEMKCINDVNDETVRIDWFKCPKCNGESEVIYNPRSMEIEKVTWKKAKNK